MTNIFTMITWFNSALDDPHICKNLRKNNKLKKLHVYYYKKGVYIVHASDVALFYYFAWLVNTKIIKFITYAKNYKEQKLHVCYDKKWVYQILLIVPILDGLAIKLLSQKNKSHYHMDIVELWFDQVLIKIKEINHSRGLLTGCQN